MGDSQKQSPTAPCQLVVGLPFDCYFKFCLLRFASPGRSPLSGVSRRLAKRVKFPCSGSFFCVLYFTAPAFEHSRAYPNSTGG